MKATRQNRQDLFDSFNKELERFNLEMRLFITHMVENILRTEEVKHEHDYKQFGKQAFMFQLKSMLEAKQIDESIMSQVNELINDKYGS